MTFKQKCAYKMTITPRHVMKIHNSSVGVVVGTYSIYTVIGFVARILAATIAISTLSEIGFYIDNLYASHIIDLNHEAIFDLLTQLNDLDVILQDIVENIVEVLENSESENILSGYAEYARSCERTQSIIQQLIEGLESSPFYNNNN